MKISKFHIRLSVSIVCLIMVLIFAVTAFLQHESGHARILFGWGKATVVTGSMEPEIPVGSLVLFQEQKRYVPGEVIVFHDTEGRLISHRILSMTETTLTTKGDSNKAADAAITQSQVLGKVQIVIPGLGSVMSFLSQPAVMAVAAVLLAVLFLIPEKSKEVICND